MSHIYSKYSNYYLVLVISIFAYLTAVGIDKESSVSGFEEIRCDVQMEPPGWALLERHLIDTLNGAGIEFYNTYVEPDGTVRFKERYESGMNSSDDLYEAFKGFSLHTALGGSDELDRA